MGNLDTNSIIIFLRFLAHLFLGSISGLVGLFSQKPSPSSEKINPLYATIHLILQTGPKSFRDFPSGIKIGRALFVPIMSLFRKK